MLRSLVGSEMCIRDRYQRRVRGQTTMSGMAVPALGNAPKTAEGAKQLYDEWAASYDASLKSWGYRAPQRVAEELASAGLPAESELLDLGCGTGMSGEALSAVSARLIGADISPESLEVARSKEIYSETHVANLDLALPMEAACFDGVACVGVMSYVERFDQFLGEVIRVLKPGGLFVATHRKELWDENKRDCRAQAELLVESHQWEMVCVGEPEPYMPENPDPIELSLIHI
eukprot:TRINITY_DN10461_c0_g1_i12.p1 TRINITY_DN10461_c0_g1~~TRINITY_DN10461_c0_g1_i12.p1  ORF type:complete len:232 (+),score=68.80 TRINITY_DN10461_c0_g1_i12:126-821(+)